MELKNEIGWETTRYLSLCEQCGKTIPKRRRVLRVKVFGSYGHFCAECATDPYHH